MSATRQVIYPFCVALIVLFSRLARAEDVAVFDLTDPQAIVQWKPTHDIPRLSHVPEGMLIQINGEDPYTIGPARDYPVGVPLRMILQLRSEQAGSAQVFYFENAATEARSVRFDVPAGQWSRYSVDLPPLGPGFHLRFDPPGTGGTCIVRSIRIETLRQFVEPAWPKPRPSMVQAAGLSVRSGALLLAHSGSRDQAFTITVNDKPTAIGWDRSLIGYVDHDQPVWVSLDSATCRVSGEQATVNESVTVPDPGGASWKIQRRYVPAKQSGVIDVETTITVDRDRQVIFLPMLGILPGVGSFGAAKNQAVLPGLEYLDNEPSSSEADVIGPASQRQVPESYKLTFPWMALAAEGRYIGMIWETSPEFAAMFDSPDRLFKSGGHVMGLIFPGADGSNRFPGHLLPREAVKLAAGHELHLRASLIGGLGNDITPALQQYVALRGLPAVPKVMDLEHCAALAGAGWLDSQAREGALYHHAIPGGFAAQPAADAAMLEDWLATQTPDDSLRRRLEDAARDAIAKVPAAAYDFAGISHIRYPAPSLIYGHVAENAEAADRHGHDLLARFEADGSVRYQPGAVDLGKTNSAPQANGLTAAVVAQLLQDATVTGDPELLDRGLKFLRALDKFSGTVPRGAQTWEVPLHTPDILASAQLIRAYTLGYELTGEEHLLDQARYWAWTGVPFVYLMAPAESVGLYAAIPVFGATHREAPVWMGLPVQWCALVYADALYRLLPYDASGPWKKLADGITASGIQQTWPTERPDPKRQGLLPDSFNLRTQSRNDPAINPGTLLADAVRLYDRPALYDFRTFREAGLMVHAPGNIIDPHEGAGQASFRVQSWSSRPYYLLIVGLKSPPQVRINGSLINLGAPHQYMQPEGRLILQVMGRAKVDIVTGTFRRTQ